VLALVASCPLIDSIAASASRTTAEEPMKHCNLVFIAISTLLFTACTSHISQRLGHIVPPGSASAGADTKPTTDEVTAGLKEALTTGISRGAELAAQVDGYWGNAEIRIPFPEDFLYVADKVRQLGLSALVDDFVLTLNRGAERAAAKAKPIFVLAITSMTIQDAWGILRGGDDAATRYLERTTSAQLKAEFTPVIQVALDQVQATRHYNQIITTYNQIPFVRKANPDLDDYATSMAIRGLFVLVAREEANIRKNPVARTTALLEKVFSYVFS
jgi:hypothetical protein